MTEKFESSKEIVDNEISESKAKAKAKGLMNEAETSVEKAEAIRMAKAIETKNSLLEEVEKGITKAEKRKNQAIKHAEKKVMVRSMREIAMNQRAEIKNNEQSTVGIKDRVDQNISEMTTSQIVDEQISLSNKKEKEIDKMVASFDFADNEKKRAKIETKLALILKNNPEDKNIYVQRIERAWVEAGRKYGALSDKTHAIRKILDSLDNLYQGQIIN